jgi:N-acetyl-1-D-myo-inositol-2-amino-2-deoxy-alpha-D-glucopyranoside deacetylase
LRPHVVVTYDPNGGYGHPDHIQAHLVTTAALTAAVDRWAVPKFYWTVMSPNAFREGVARLTDDDLLPDWIRLTDEAASVFVEHPVTTVIDAREHLGAKVAAMAAHATQVSVGPSGRAFALSNNIALPVLAQEHYVLISGEAGDTDSDGLERDLLAGLTLK